MWGLKAGAIRGYTVVPGMGHHEYANGIKAKQWCFYAKDGARILPQPRFKLGKRSRFALVAKDG
jgi:hypothetical protein